MKVTPSFVELVAAWPEVRPQIGLALAIGTDIIDCLAMQSGMGRIGVAVDGDAPG